MFMNNIWTRCQMEFFIHFEFLMNPFSVPEFFIVHLFMSLDNYAFTLKPYSISCW